MRVASFVLFAALTLCSVPPLRSESLGDVLSAHHLPADFLPESETRQPITSYAVSADNYPFLLAYYTEDGSGTLPSLLHIIRYDGRSRKLRQTDLRGTVEKEPVSTGDVMRQVWNFCMGSALRIAEENGFITIDTHLTPSAGCVLILTPDLNFSAGLTGWLLGRVDGQIIFEESMVHFSSTSPARLLVYDPRHKRSVAIYPARTDPARHQFSAELQKHMPPADWCRQQNNPCDPERFSTAIDRVAVRPREHSFEFDAVMDASGFGEDAERSIRSKIVHYVCQQRNGKWLLASK